MKSERRHELQTNTLADWVGHQVEAAKPHLGLLVTVLVAAVAIVFAWMYFRAWNTAQTAAAWTDFYKAADQSEPAALLEVAKRHAGEPASLWAVLLASDVHLANGAERAFSDRKEAEKLLKQAIQGYETVLKDGREPLLRRRAFYGLGEANEALFAVTGDTKALEAARENFDKVAQQWPDTVLGKSAEKKSAKLATESTREFLVWFSQQEPAPPTSPSTEEEPASAGSPFDLTTLPGASELLLPDEDEAATTELQPPQTNDAAASEETPETSETPKTDETPTPSEPSETPEQPEAANAPKSDESPAPSAATEPADTPESNDTPESTEESESTEAPASEEESEPAPSAQQ